MKVRTPLARVYKAVHNMFTARTRLLNELARTNSELQELNRSLRSAVDEKNKLLDQLKQQAADLERQTHEDGLTGLFNRKHFDNQFGYEFSRANRYGRSLVVIMADIDYFKKVNDTYGHQTGDAVLRVISTILKDTCRTVDFVARYGGEEFVVLLPETPSNGGIIVGERIRKSAEEYDWSTIKPEMKVTLSLGLTSNSGYNDHWRMLGAADAKLYDAKHGGRNQLRY